MNDSAQSKASPGEQIAADEARAMFEALLRDMPDIPRDVDEMSSEDWTALNDWFRKARQYPS